ncbi:TPA: hypothetical protein PXN96_004273 [Yersinia enterocolitica]|uniref:hypothetical protein n=1 Tax=Yersinia enterocolitica TaxID=630 RepID=UPI003F4723C2|nr:hypothetical protein [Yersinia enterocolitica]
MSAESIISLDTLKEQIPYYLSQEQKTTLTKALSDFPKMANFYLSSCHPEFKHSLLQGDIFQKLSIFSEQGKREVKGIILSNSCDIDCSNKRDLPAKALFAPLINLDLYAKLLEKNNKPAKDIETKINAIREQKITNIVFLPAFDELPDSIVLLDDVYHMRADALNEHLTSENKLITLSQVGFYIFVFKLSLHFCRFHENVARFEN